MNTRFKPSRFMALLALLSLTACQSANVPQQNSAPRTELPFNEPLFQFVVMGDRTGGHRPGVFSSALRQVNLLQPTFVMGVGDLIEGYTDNVPELSAQWDEFDDIVNQLEMPFFYTVGNHDISNTTMRDVWQQRYGPTYWSFVYRDVLFISLDTEDPPIALPDPYVDGQRRLEAAMARDAEGTQQMLLQRSRERPEPVRLPGSVAISDQQLAFVERTLADHSDVAWTVLLMHKPAWLYGSEAFAQIEQRLNTRDYTVFAGHEHYYTYEQRAGRDYIDMGTTGGVWLQDGPGRLDHVALVTMTKNGPIVAQLALNGVFDKRGPRPEPAGLTEESPVEAAGETYE